MACAVEADPLSQLEEDLECTVCLEVLKDPRTLPCCHSFCKDCLESVVKTCRDKAPHGQPVREIPCPNCRAKFPLDPDKHVADMPRNHFICNLVKVTAVLDRGIGVPCSHNCSQSYSVARCVTCENFLCRECLTAHNNYRGNNGHSVLTMEELSKPENRKKIKDKMYCNEHSGKKLKVYCETCNQLICKDCMDFKHIKQEGHSCFLVKDVTNNYKDLLALNNKAMEDALTQGNVFVQRLSLTTQQHDRDAENAKIEIAQRKEFVAKKVLEMLDKKAESLSKKVDEIHKGNQANLDRQTEETNQFVENIKASVQLSKRLVDQGTEEEIISSQKMMLDNANNLLAKREEYFKASIPVTKLRYTPCAFKEPINEEILRGLANSLGEVNGGNEVYSQVSDIPIGYQLPEMTKIRGGKSNLNPKAAAFSTSGTHSSFTPTSYSCAVTGNIKSEKEKNLWAACPICLSKMTDKKTLDKCGHSFCAKCIDKAFKMKKQCPSCSMLYGPLRGNQPKGNMFDSFKSTPLPGFGSCGTTVISYRFPNGTQGPDHPNPGKPYPEAIRTAYLPDNDEGRKVLKLLKKAFEQKLTFTIGRSATTGRDDRVIWNDIPHKTSMAGGPTCFGYPDPNYLKSVQEKLAAIGITE